MTPDTLRTLDREATPGPWKVTHRAGHYAVEGGAPEGHAQPIVARAAGLESADAEANARLIAYVRTHLSEIIAHLDAGWLPIEQAPKRRSVLVFIPRADQPSNLPNGTCVVAYQTDYGEPFKETWRYATGVGAGQQCGWPTHFRHLPEPPLPHPPAGEGGRG